MTAVKKWVAAGSSAAVLAGGLFLGAPAAHAADEACGADQAGLLAAASAVHDAGVHFNSLVDDAETRAELEAAQVALEEAIVSSNVKGPAEDAWNSIRSLQASYAAEAGSVEVTAAAAAADTAAANFRAVALESGATMEDGACLVALFEGTYGPLITGIGTGTGGDDSTGTDGSGDWTGTDGSGDWSGTGAEGDSASGVNQGINMQTAGEGGPGAGLLAALLASGAAVAGAVAFRIRRARA